MRSKIRITINEKVLLVASIAYLYIPLFIFFITWTKWYMALIAVSASIYGFAVFINSDDTSMENHDLIIEIIPFIIIALSLLIVGIIAGWGGWMPQASDWIKHNALLNDLVKYDWPVYYTEASSPSMLTYYIGQYIIPALIGKLTGSYRVAEIMLYIWGEAGLFLVSFHLMKIFNASTVIRQFCVIGIFLLFGGSLILSQKTFGLVSGVLSNDIHWMTSVNGSQLQYRNIFVDLRWVMPQCIAAWLIVSLWWKRHSKVEHYIFLILPALLYSALAFFGLAVMAVICAIYEAIFKKITIKAFLKKIFSFSNIVCLLAVGLPLLLYFSGVIFSEKDASVGFSVQHISLLLYITFCLWHFGIYVLLSFKYHLKSGIFISAVIMLIVLPFFKLGYYNYLVMSTSIPAIFIVMICVIDTIFKKPRSLRAFVLYLFLAIGAIQPLKEMKTVIVNNDFSRLDHRESEESLIPFSDLASEKISYKYNYFSYNVEDNPFIKYLAKAPFQANILSSDDHQK